MNYKINNFKTKYSTSMRFRMKSKYDGMSFYKLENGLIVEAYLVGNELFFIKQLGGLPSEDAAN